LTARVNLVREPDGRLIYLATLQAMRAPPPPNGAG